MPQTIDDDKIDLMSLDELEEWLNREEYFKLIPNQYINKNGNLIKPKKNVEHIYRELLKVIFLINTSIC